ncbi:hypothetical protein [Psychromonas aquimarina]|uniref:hypothetical protein n=1 Tax=Psychromonas aquimarina TaxID=444919 RepID=UPI000422D156|nr:hypothetical protein [Psychromonas aquimarina]
MLKSIDDMKFVFLALFLAIFTQTVTDGTPLFSMWDSFIAMSIIVFLSLVAKHYLDSPLPTFAYATIIGIVICLPDTIVRIFVLDSIGKVGFLSCCVPLLAFAGLSVGGRMEELKKLSWKIIVLFLVVSTSCFFGASLIAQIGFSMKGII